MEKDILNIKTLGKIQKTAKNKISGIIFTRALCSIGILIFHYSCSSKYNFKFLFRTANSSFGFMFSTSFFCISGTVLYYNYPKINFLKIFYYKRWKSIFPPYYICFSYFFLITAFANHRLFYNGHWSRLIFTLLGMDGYLNYRIKTYFIIGEWFLGAIIIIYILYPLLLWFMNKNIFIIFFIISVFYVIMYKTNIFIILADKNIITCMHSFYFGMISIKFKSFFFTNKIAFIISSILFLFLSFKKLNNFILVFQIQAFSLYIMLIQLGNYILSKSKTNVFNQISALSYSIFLIHHRIIFDVLGLNNPLEWYLHILQLGFVFILTIICSKVHILVINSVLNSYIFQKLDSFFMV